MDPIQWWVGHCAQFLNLSYLGQDILSIPGVFLLFALNYSYDVSKGSAVAVEHIFSGACDHSHSHVSQTVAVPCLRSYLGYYR